MAVKELSAITVRWICKHVYFRTSNAAAMKMYQKHGFVNTFAMDEDDYFMIRGG